MKVKRIDDNVLDEVSGGAGIITVQKGIADPAGNMIAVENGTDGGAMLLGGQKPGGTSVKKMSGGQGPGSNPNIGLC